MAAPVKGPRPASRVRIVLGGGFLAVYPQGGGHWSVFLQYLLGLRALGHDVFWLEVMRSSGNPGRDRYLIRAFFQRMARYGFKGCCALLLHRPGAGPASLSSARAFGMSKRRIQTIIQEADLLWNFCWAIREPLLSLFRRRALVDLDPGHLQVSAMGQETDIQAHDVFLTVGLRMDAPGCEVPALGVRWRPFLPIVYLPMWESAAAPGRRAPFTSVTHWTWEELQLNGRVYSVSKRSAYFKYVEIPRRTGRPFELAVHLHPKDTTGDRELLKGYGWRLIHPYRAVRSPAAYQRFIRNSRAEFACPKPIHVQLRTGWFSDRSAAYLASGRPVLAEDTGFSGYLPAGEGLLAFQNLEEAVAGVERIDARYAFHSRAARAFAEEFLDFRRNLGAMLAICLA